MEQETSSDLMELATLADSLPTLEEPATRMKRIPIPRINRGKPEIVELPVTPVVEAANRAIEDEVKLVFPDHTQMDNAWVNGILNEVKSCGQKYMKQLRVHNPELYFKVVGAKVEKALRQSAEFEEKDLFKCNPKDLIGFFVTYRPPDDFDLNPGERLENILMKLYLLTKKKAWKYTIATIEQAETKPNDRFKGIHFHCVLMLDKESQSGERKKAYNAIKSCMKAEHPALNIKGLTIHSFPPRIAYCKGHKKDKLKEPMMQQDEALRTKYDIPMYIETGNCEY